MGTEGVDVLNAEPLDAKGCAALDVDELKEKIPVLLLGAEKILVVVVVAGVPTADIAGTLEDAKTDPDV